MDWGVVSVWTGVGLNAVILLGASQRRSLRRATDEASRVTAMKDFMARLEAMEARQTASDEKRQEHELTCARIQERNTAEQRRTAEILVRHGDLITNLLAQDRNRRLGVADKVAQPGEGLS